MRNPGRSGAAADALGAVRAANKGSLWFMRGPRGGTDVAHALLRAASSLHSTLLLPGPASVGKSADAASKSACATYSWRRLFGDAGDVRSVIGQAAIELAQPLGIHKRFQDAAHLEAVFAATQLAQKSEVHNLLDVAIHPVHQLGFVGRVGEEQAHQVGDLL